MLNPMLYLDSECVRKKVRTYIRRCAKPYGSESHHIRNKFNREMSNEIIRVGKLKACENWLRGLGIDVDYMPHDIAKVMAVWFDGTEEEWLDWLDENGDDIYWKMMARELMMGM